jgi:hypothetical protein
VFYSVGDALQFVAVVFTAFIWIEAFQNLPNCAEPFSKVIQIAL